MDDPLTAFLTARLDEDEAVALAAGSCDYYDDMDESVPLRDELNHALRHAPARVLREVAAKRAILADYLKAIDDYAEFDVIRVNHLRRAVKLFAAIYDGHPDYDGGWAP